MGGGKSLIIINVPMANVKTGFISGIVNSFNSKNRIVNTFANDEYTGRSDDYWESYTEKMKAVTPDDVLAVAQKFLHADELVFLVVGDPEAVQEGSRTGQDGRRRPDADRLLPLFGEQTVIAKVYGAIVHKLVITLHLGE